jgi:WD40 repeat protein
VSAREIANLYVYNALRRVAPQSDPRALVQKTLAAFLQERHRAYDEKEERPIPRALIFDQFEEMFTLYPERWQEQQDALFRQISEALDSDPLLRVVLIIREDYLPQLDPFTRLLPEGLRIRFRLERLRQDQALDAVVKPLANTPYKFADGAAKSLVKELARIRTVVAAGEEWVEGPYVEPVQHQVVCMRLWSRRRRDTGVISLEDIEKLNIDRALAEFYEDVIKAAITATGVTEFQLRTWFGEILITPLGTRGTVFKERESTGGIPNAAVEVLEEQHLIRAEYRSGASWYELAHDRFIEPIQASNRTWLDEREEALHARQRLEQKAAEWVRLGRGQGGLLDEVELLETDRWLADPSFNDLGDSAELSELVQASRKEIEKAREEKEAAQRRELEHAQALEAEQRQLADEQAAVARLYRRHRNVLAVCLALVVAAVVWGYLGWQNAIWHRNKAKDQAQNAALSKAVATSISNLDTDPELSILLALHAAQAGKAAGKQRVVNEAADALGRAISASRIRMTLRTDAKEAPTVAYNHDGTLLATKGRDNTVIVWDVSTGEQLRSLRKHTDFVSAVAFASENNLLATASSDKTARVWDAVSGKELVSLEHDSEVVSVAFSAVGELLATAEASGFLRLWNVTTGKPATGLGLNGRKYEWVTALSLSPDGKYLATASRDGTVAVWTVSTGEERFDRLSHDDMVYSVRFSPNGKLLAAASMDRTVKIWHADTGEELSTLSGHTNTVFDVAFSPARDRIATASADTTVRLYDLHSGRHLFTLVGHSGPIESVSFSPDTRHVATASWDGTARVWYVYGHPDVIHTVAFSEDGRRLATAGSDGTTPVWDADTGEALLYGRINEITHIALSHNGDRIAAGNKYGEVMIWDAGSREPKHTLSGHHRGQVIAIAFNRDGDRLATASRDGTAVLWDAVTGKPLFDIKRDYRLTSLAFSPDGLRLAIGDMSGIVRVWDTTTEESRELLGHGRQVFNMAFSPNGKRLASASEDGSALLWDLASKDGAPRKLDHKGLVFDVRFSPDGTRLVTVSADGTAKVWEVESKGKLPLTLQGHTSIVESGAFSPDGSRLATASWDRTARVWDAASGEELLKLTHNHEVKGIGFSANGTRLTTASAHGEVRVHFFDIEKLIELTRTRRRITRSLTPEECVPYQELGFCSQ